MSGKLFFAVTDRLSIDGWVNEVCVVVPYCMLRLKQGDPEASELPRVPDTIHGQFVIAVSNCIFFPCSLISMITKTSPLRPYCKATEIPARRPPSPWGSLLALPSLHLHLSRRLLARTRRTHRPRLVTRAAVQMRIFTCIFDERQAATGGSSTPSAYT